MSPRTETAYKAEALGKLAQHNKAPSSGATVNAGVVIARISSCCRLQLAAKSADLRCRQKRFLRCLSTTPGLFYLRPCPQTSRSSSLQNQLGNQCLRKFMLLSGEIWPTGRPATPVASRAVTHGMIGQKSAEVLVVATMQRRTEPWSLSENSIWLRPALFPPGFIWLHRR